MKQNNIIHKTQMLLLKNAIFFCIAFIVLTNPSGIQAAGRVFIRKAPGVDVKIQVSNTLGFNSDWVNLEKIQDQKSVPIRFPVNSIRPGFNRVVPENPKQQRPDSSNEPFYTGLEFKKGIFLINVKGKPDNYQIMLPEPASFCPVIPSLKTEVSQPKIDIKPEEVFLNGEARRILVWNGKEDETSEQLLICNDRIRSVNGQIEAVLNIMPLPGKPLHIKRASDNYDAFEEELIKKFGRQRKGINNKPYVWNGRVAPYCAQSIEAHNLDEFLRKAENMVFGLYGDSARLHWQPVQLAAIHLLLEKGYTWFSLDVSMLMDWGTITEPIAYRTKTDSSAVIPLLDGKIGGAYEYTVTKAIVITPGKLDFKDNTIWSDDNIIIFGNNAIEFTADELQKICPEVGAFCKEHKMDKVLVRLMILNNKITEYPGDLVIVNQKQFNNSQTVGESPVIPDQNNESISAPAVQKDVPKTDKSVEPTKKTDAKPTETPQDNNPAPSKGNSQSKKVQPPA